MLLHHAPVSPADANIVRIGVLIPVLGDGQLSTAFSIATATRDESQRARALSVLGPRLEGIPWQAACDSARAMTRPEDRLLVLRALFESSPAALPALRRSIVERLQDFHDQRRNSLLKLLADAQISCTPILTRAELDDLGGSVLDVSLNWRWR